MMMIIQNIILNIVLYEESDAADRKYTAKKKTHEMHKIYIENIEMDVRLQSM